MTNPFNNQTDDFYDLLWQQGSHNGFGRFHIKVDPACQLFAVIAIHSTLLGPALGGCRMVDYPSLSQGIQDAMRLARSMSYKSALANVAIGGGKTVIVKPKTIQDRQALFEAYADFVDELNGQYITAVDSGTAIEDMDVIAERTPYVATCSALQGDPSPFTAWGVLRGIEAAVNSWYGLGTLQGLHVAIQGVGHVGTELARFLVEKGAKVTVSDVNEARVQGIVAALGVGRAAVDAIHTIDADVFAPCALGSVIHEGMIDGLKARIVAGGVNNLLAHDGLGQTLFDRGILCAPDYVINAGGLMFAADRYYNTPYEATWDKVDGIYQTLLSIFDQSKRLKRAPNQVADAMAHDKLAFMAPPEAKQYSA